ncbi:putative zinc finger protein 462-like [Scophthalmus maximus]|uniref:Putative zinc finger protein 462-like n=1 Tax=Scophthalmus maximus TaxID=52904 RepID=A0A2U9BVF4_SCOMX|nr:putative zinc finger protein 462-like [Scophthalmus maximus]
MIRCCRGSRQSGYSREKWRKRAESSGFQHRRLERTRRKPEPWCESAGVTETRGLGDSVHFSSSGHTMHNVAAAEEPSAKSFRCSRCTFISSSKVSLRQHLNTVHGSGVDTDPRDDGFNQSETYGATTDGKSDRPGVVFLCQRCEFKAHSRGVLIEHDRLCSQKSETQNVMGNPTISKKQETEIRTVTSTSNSTCAPHSSKDLKKYKGPLQMQTITKYFAAASRSSGKPSVKSPESPVPQDSTKGTLILQESPSGSSPNSSGVFKVTAQSMIDITRNTNHRFLLNDQVLTTDLRPPRPNEQFKEEAPGNNGKRTNSERSESCPAKKAKMDEQDAKLPEKANASELQPSSSTDLLFEISEDEEEKKVDLLNGDAESPKVYLCKQCDYRDVSFSRMSTHYQNDHPYIRYDNAYIRDTNNQSATFRCLECPVEFLSVDDLETHYKENHPEAPNVFTVHSSELVFKCFLCPAIANASRALKVHYREMHSTHKAGNSLLYCRYSATRCQEGSSELNTCDTALGSERSEWISPKNADTKYKEDRNTPSPLSPTSRQADMLLYQCNNCEFSHKSVVVMHVHYQKKHPDEAVTIDKIKQSTPVTSHTSSQATPEKSMTVTPQTDISNSSQSEKAEPSQQNISLSFKNLKHTPDTSETHSEKEKKTKTPPRKSSRALSSGMDSSYSSSPDKVFYCQSCSYSNTNIRSVVAHHNMKHAMHGLTCREEVFLYNVKVQKQKLRSDAETSTSTASSDSRLRKKVDVWREKETQNEEDGGAVAPSVGLNPYACAENLFYCQKCNYGNPTLKGVLNHQAKAHQGINTNHECIIKHTALIHNDIEKSKSQTTESSPSSHLPLPLMDGGDENRFFCHFCNYRHETVAIVVKHYFTIHRGFAVKAEYIHQHTSELLSQMGRLPRKSSASQEDDGASLQKKVDKKKKVKKFANCSSVSASSSLTATEAQRILQCHRCAYNTPYVYMLRRHMWKIHRSNNSMNDILKVCFKRGMLGSGYHCDWCVFSHQNAADLFKHYREKHPENKQSLECISSRLYVGPDIVLSRKRKSQTTRTGDVGGGDGADGGIPSPRFGPNETKTYSCRACSFKGSSMSSITSHYRAVHPWSVKDDGSVLNVITSKKPSANSHIADDQDETPEFFDAYQVPLEFGNSPGSPHDGTDSPTMLKCHHCPATFSNHHGLKTHCGIKHPEAETKTPGRAHVFNCPYCSYVNSGNHGILTHCQMRHPDLECRADSHQVDETHLQIWGSCLTRKGESLRFSGYLCKTCLQIFATPEMLNSHCENDHDGTVPNIVPNGLRPAPKASAVRKLRHSNAHSTLGSVSKASFLHRCQLCSYSSSTKIALSRHVRVHHRNSSFSRVKDCVYKCVLCPRYYFTKTHLGSHYAKKHGKNAYIKYFTQVYKQVTNKSEPTSPNCPLTQQPENTPEVSESSAVTEDGKILVYKCPSCDYVNASYHGILTHCQMKHPTVLARADDLKTDEVLVTDMVRCSRGKSSNERGYMCKNCPQIHATSLKLRMHCEREHNWAKPAASKHSSETETEKWPHHSSRSSVSESTSSKNKSSPINTPGIDLSQQLGSPETSVQEEELPYKCGMCSYSAICRKYLYCHYKNTHKLDALGTFNLLKRYNKRKRKAPKAKSEGSATVQCKKCPDLMFDSAQLLIDHYTTFHGSDCKSDFIVLSQRSQRSSGIYKCAHCRKQLYGIRKLCRHLDRHRARRKRKAMAAKAMASVVMTATSSVDASSKICQQDELPLLETVQDLTRWNVALVKTFSLQTSPLPSPSKPADPEPPEPSEESKRTCRHCGRTFMSLKGLRSHERSHAALAAIKKLDHLPTLGLKHNMNKYIVYKSGTIKPFLCGICSYRTTVLGLWRSHFRKKHQGPHRHGVLIVDFWCVVKKNSNFKGKKKSYVLMDPTETDSRDEDNTQRANKEPTNLSEENHSGPEPDEELEMTERSLYLEPPDVQRQLNHYMLMAQTGDASKVNQQIPDLNENGLLHCEFCNFNTGHMSSVRRHYLNRHGKKILRCKDCSFFTALRKTLEMHMETGHSMCQSEPTHQKDLRCPFCLYQTKNKNNMIDHIVLHREERVVPIEVCRPKLSRYLQGVVFRCHKCTFTSGCAENLRLHMMKHDDIKPYKCRLCYFDCTLLSDLEAHLSDKHQVVRNHELVGQVSLDQLKARVDRMPEEDEERPLSNLEQHNSEEEQDVKINIVTDCSEVLHETLAVHPADANIGKQTTPRMKEACLKQESQEQAGIVFLPDTARGQMMKDTFEPNVENKADTQSEECIGPERERQTNEKQPKVRGSEDNGVIFPRQKEEEAEGSSATYGKMVGKRESHKLNINALQHRTLNLKLDARAEEEVLRRVLVLEEEGSSRRMHEEAHPERRVKKEHSGDETIGECPEEEGSTPLAHKPTLAVNSKARKSHMQANHVRSQQIFTFKSDSLTPLPNCVQVKTSHGESAGVSLANCKEEEVCTRKNGKELTDPYGEMPILENEYLKDAPQALGSCKKEEEDEMIIGDNKNRCKEDEEGDGIKESDSPHGHKSAGGASEVLCPSVTENKLYTCDLCGRNLTNSSDLKHHIMRHGI